MGIATSSQFRYRAGILHVLGEAAEDGHCFLPHTELIERVVQRLDLEDHHPNPDSVEFLIHLMAQERELVKTEMPIAGLEQFGYYAPSFFAAEQKLAARLQQLLKHPLTVDQPRVQRWLDRFVETTGTPLSEQQRHAVAMAASERVLILTGGPGCGKTFTTRTIGALWKAMGKSIALASPTGRAAQRLGEMTGQEAKTVHRLLEFDPKTMKFKRDEENSIPAQAIVVDEASMLDLFLANSLIKAIAPDTQLLLVGDTDQLPSVGPGSVLQDLIASGQVPVVRLTQVFRQAQASQIVRNAHRINSGQLPQLESVSNDPQSDCLWLGAPEPEDGVGGIRDLITHLIPQLGFNGATDVQVLCPMTRGMVGTRNLNTVLQELINPPHLNKAEIAWGGTILRVGDPEGNRQSRACDSEG